MIGDELIHTIKHLAQQAMAEQRPWAYGHISTYNPSDHTARVIVPSMLDDQTMAPLHSGWLPVGTGSVGSKFGIQIVPFGGATAESPTLGELAMVAINERGSGVAAILCTFFTSVNQPPNAALDSSKRLKPGEIIILHASGSLLRFHASGDIEHFAAGDGAITLTTSGSGGIAATTTGDGSVVLSTTGSGSVSVAAVGSGTITLISPNPITVQCPTLAVTGDITATGNITPHA